MRSFLLAGFCAFLILMSGVAQARHHRLVPVASTEAASPVAFGFGFAAPQSSGMSGNVREHRHHRLNPVVAGLGAGLAHMLGSMQPHPAGCPSRAFCGCGVSVRVFGHSVRSLWLAANWYRFPRGAVEAGNVIVQPHHVKYIESVEGNGTLICYDPNSGGHLTRVHACRVDGRVVNPRGAL